MEDNTPHPKGSPQKPHPVEHDYNAHQDDPGPAPEAMEKKGDAPAAKTMNWIILIIIIILFIVYWFMFRKETSLF